MTMAIKPTGFYFGRYLSMGLLLGILGIIPVCAQSQEEKPSQTENLHYISPRLQLGIHTEPTLDSPIKALISSGSPVTVISTKKGFSQVKTDQNTQGWLKSKFLTREAPAELKLTQLEQSLLETQQLLAEKQAGESLDADPETQERVSNTEFQAKMTAYEETIAELKAEIKAWEQLDSQDKQAHKKQAQQINKLLEERLVKIASLAAGKDVNASYLNIPDLSTLSEASEVVQLPFLKEIKKDYLLNIVIGVSCFFLGIFLMDLFNRRRHGGYRV